MQCLMLKRMERTVCRIAEFKSKDGWMEKTGPPNRLMKLVNFQEITKRGLYLQNIFPEITCGLNPKPKICCLHNDLLLLFGMGSVFENVSRIFKVREVD